MWFGVDIKSVKKIVLQKKKKKFAGPVLHPSLVADPSHDNKPSPPRTMSPTPMTPTPRQPFTFEDGVPNSRGRILGGSSAIRSTTGILRAVKNVVSEIQSTFR